MFVALRATPNTNQTPHKKASSYKTWGRSPLSACCWTSENARPASERPEDMRHGKDLATRATVRSAGMATRSPSNAPPTRPVP